MIRAFVHSGGGPGKPTPDADPPAGLDWDMWCGPAPLRPSTRRSTPAASGSFSTTPTARWATGASTGWTTSSGGPTRSAPKMVCSTGGRHIAEDNTDAPDTQTVEYEFDGFTAVWEHRRYGGQQRRKAPAGHLLLRHRGHAAHRLAERRHDLLSPLAEQGAAHERAAAAAPARRAEHPGALGRFSLVRSRSGKRPVCDIEIGHRSTS